MSLPKLVMEAALNISSNLSGSSHEEVGHQIHLVKVDPAWVAGPLIITAWLVAAIVAKIGFSKMPRLNHILPESCLYILLGNVIGGVMYFLDSATFIPLKIDTSSYFTGKIFFNFMLPPIILNAGYFMPNRLFFDNLGTILVMAVAQTMWNVFAIGLSLWGLNGWVGYGINIEGGIPLFQCMLLGTLISSVDPVAILAIFEEVSVNKLLFIVVAGESLLSDAIIVPVYEMFEDYASMKPEEVTLTQIGLGILKFPIVCLGGGFIGILFGIVTAYATKFTEEVSIVQPVLVISMSYLAYLLGDMFHVSGILATTICAMLMKNYVELNISHNAKVTLRYCIGMLCSTSETIIFVLFGVTVVSDNHLFNTKFTVATLGFCIMYRFIGVYGLAAICNMQRLTKLSTNDKLIMAYGGLRGSMSIALALLIPQSAVNFHDETRRTFLTTSVVIVYATVFLQGMTLKPIVNLLSLTGEKEAGVSMNQRSHERLMDYTMSGIESIVGTVGKFQLRQIFKRFDNSYIRPHVVRENNMEPKILETFHRLNSDDPLTMAKDKSALVKNLELTPIEPDKSKSEEKVVEMKQESVKLRRRRVGTSEAPVDADLSELLEESLNEKFMMENNINLRAVYSYDGDEGETSPRKISRSQESSQRRSRNESFKSIRSAKNSRVEDFVVTVHPDGGVHRRISFINKE